MIYRTKIYPFCSFCVFDELGTHLSVYSQILILLILVLLYIGKYIAIIYETYKRKL